MRRTILLFLLIAPLTAVALWQYSPLGAITIVFISHMLLLYPTLRASSQWLGPVVTSFETTENEVWLTIDDGPTGQTEEIVRVLTEHGARATFFVKGSNVESSPATTRTVAEAGCEVANHSYSHPSGTFWMLTRSRIAREIDDCQEAIRRTTGRSPSRFRAPVGMKNLFVHPLLAHRDLILIGWSARAFDGVGGATPEQALSRLKGDIRPGAIILLHEGRRNSVDVIKRLLEELRQSNFRAVIPTDNQLVARYRPLGRRNNIR